MVRADLARRAMMALLDEYALPSQEIHVVFPSPRYVPAKARVFIEFLSAAFAEPRWGFKTG